MAKKKASAASAKSKAPRAMKSAKSADNQRKTKALPKSRAKVKKSHAAVSTPSTKVDLLAREKEKVAALYWNNLTSACWVLEAAFDEMPLDWLQAIKERRDKLQKEFERAGETNSDEQVIACLAHSLVLWEAFGGPEFEKAGLLK